jgi:hypothetical protein
MRKWNVLAAVAAVALVAPVAFAQPDDIKKDLQEMKARLSAVEAENAALRAQVGGQDDSALESQISAITERYAAGTTVKSAANPVTLSGEFRFRNSWSWGDNKGARGNNPNPAGFDKEHDGSWVDSIVRLGFQYDFTRDVTAFAELQSRWAFGTGSSTTLAGAFSRGVQTDVDLHQGWLEVRNIFNRPEFSSRTGRQEIVLGNQYQFGNADWYNGWALDASRWDWDSESFSLTAIVAKLNSSDGDINQAPSFQTFHDDDELYSLYFTLKTIKNHALDLYWIYLNGHGPATGGSGFSISSLSNANFPGFLSGPSVPGTTTYFHTVGARIGGVFPDIACGLDWNLEGAYQFGDENTPTAANPSNDNDIDAFSVEAELGLTFSKDSKFRIYTRFLWADGPDGNRDNGYIPIYPNRHSNGGFRARYGVFDLIPMTNVITLQLGLHFDPDPAWTLGATGLWAEADSSADAFNIGPSPAGAGASLATIRDDDYGWEIDVWGEYRYSDHLVFNAGLAFFFADNAAEDLWLIDDDTQFYGYVQARLNF